MIYDADDYEADRDAAIEAAFRVLRPMEATVLDLYFGLSNRDPLTLHDIARQLDVSLREVKRIKESALVALRRWNPGGDAGMLARLSRPPPDPLVGRELLPGDDAHRP